MGGHLLLHTPRQDYLAKILLDLVDRGFLKFVPHDVEVTQVLLELILSNVDKQLLRDAVAAHVSLDRRCMVILVLLDHRHDVELLSATPSMLDSFGRPDARLLKLVELDLGDEPASKGLKSGCSSMLHRNGVARLQLDQ